MSHVIHKMQDKSSYIYFEANLEIEEHKTKSKVLRVEDRKVD